MSNTDSRPPAGTPVASVVVGPPHEGAPAEPAAQAQAPRSLASVIDEHAVELTYRRAWVSRRIPFAAAVAAWDREMDSFIREIVEPQLGTAITAMYGRAALQHAINSATSRHPSARFPFEIANESSPFEHRVADALEALGWKVDLTNGVGHRCLDVMANMRERSVLIHCVFSADHVSRDAVFAVYNEMAASGFHHSAVVSNGGFTPQAIRQAAGTRTVLLHHDTLHRLEEVLFGSDTWRALPPHLIIDRKN